MREFLNPELAEKRDVIIRPFSSSYTPKVEVDYGYSGYLASPLIQVFSVYIATDFDDGKPCEIYGSIRALEGPCLHYHLYDRDPEDSETIKKDGTLSLIGPDGGAIIPSTPTTLDLCLKDRIRGVEVVNGQLNLDPMTKDSYDRLLRGIVQGSHGFAYVYYAVFKFALYAIVQVKVIKNDNAADIYGSLVARYKNSRRYCSVNEQVKWLETRLFDRPSHQPLRVLVGTPIRLSRNVVVVPACSTLVLELNLWDSNGKIASDCLQDPANMHAENPFYIRTQYVCVEVGIKWCQPYFHLDRARKMEYSSKLGGEKKTEEVQKKPRVLHNQHLSASLVPRPIPSAMKYVGDHRAEVFTVFVDGINEKISALCGTILIDDGSDIFSIYKRDESCSELLPDNGLACIEVNYRALQDSHFTITLDLRDPVGKLEVSRGHFGCVLSNLPGNNNQLCSVVPGKDGYAAVHYGVFNNAFEAFLKVKLFGNGDPDILISLYGTLIACYGGHNYSTSYHKKYFRSRLFDCPRDKSVELKTGSGIAVLKSIVVVPAKSSLIIKANLGVFGINNVDEPIRGKAEFEIDLSGTTSQIIRGKDYWIEIYATFKK